MQVPLRGKRKEEEGGRRKKKGKTREGGKGE